MAIGIESKCKINSNIGNSATTSNIQEELEKLSYSVKFGADTVMDLSTGGGIHEIREANLCATALCPWEPSRFTRPFPASIACAT